MNVTKNRSNVIAYTVNKYMDNDLFISVQNGDIVVRAPWYYTNNQIQDVIEEKKNWILSKINANNEVDETEEIQNEYSRMEKEIIQNNYLRNDREFIQNNYTRNNREIIQNNHTGKDVGIIKNNYTRNNRVTKQNNYSRIDNRYKAIKESFRNISKEKSDKDCIRNEIVKILGEDCKVIVNYKNLKRPTLIVEGKNIKISLPNKFKKLDREEILLKLIEKLYDTLAEKEIERSMEKARKLLNFAPEDYKIERMKNIVGKCDYENKVITINPEIVIYNREIIDYIVVHEFCHLKCKTHSKKMKDMLNKYVPNYEKLEEQIKSKY